MRPALFAFVLMVFGCGREDVELASHAPPSVPEGDCSAVVPDGLVGARPPMGWNGYNAFGCDAALNEAKLEETIEALISSGMQSAGYRFVNLDACWQGPRSADGSRTFDPVRLPGGVYALSQALHDRGLSFGVFAPVGDCLGEPGGAGYEAVDAKSYASWQADYVKYAMCSPGDAATETTISKVRDELARSGRSITLSIAAPPFQEWMRESAQLWRTAGNSDPTWASLLQSIDATVPLAAYARPGAFSDPDMLEIGNGALTESEKRLQFSVWSILSAPLLAGNDLTSMTESTRAVLVNSDVIALNQDPLGLQAALIRREGEVEVLAKPLAECGARGVVLWNRGDSGASLSLALSELWLEGGPATARDLWTDAPVAVGAEGLTVTVPSHDAVALRVKGGEPPLPRGRVALSDLRWTYVANHFGPVELDRTNGEDAALDGQPIRLRGAAYTKGLGVHGPSLIRYRLGGACSRFIADVGIDDDQDGQGSAQFEVWADGERLFQSGVLTGTSPARAINVDVTGRRELRLFVGNGGDSATRDHGVWAGATVECRSSP